MNYMTCLVRHLHLYTCARLWFSMFLRSHQLQNIATSSLNSWFLQSRFIFYLSQQNQYEITNSFASCWKTTDSSSRPTWWRNYWQLTLCKHCPVKRRECQIRSNRRRKLLKFVQIVTAIATNTFMAVLLILQTTQLPFRPVSILCTKHEVLFFIKRAQILTVYPSASTYHCGLW